MDLGDKPIVKAGFEKPIEIEAPAPVDEMDFNDEFDAPKALESVMPPTSEKDNAIESEIERLEQRLNELKAKAAEKG
jgi:BMFP domain-containing protein YqiC